MKKYKIFSSLKYGKIYSPFIAIILILGLVCSLIMTPLIIILLLEYNLTIDFLGIFCIGLFGLAIFSFIFLLVKLIEAHKSIKLSLKDAVELEATAKLTDKNGKTSFSFLYEEFLTVQFFYQNEKIFRTSTKASAKRPFIGYEKAFSRYAGKTIRILYSPSQDHVLLLK